MKTIVCCALLVACAASLPAQDQEIFYQNTLGISIVRASFSGSLSPKNNKAKDSDGYPRPFEYPSFWTFSLLYDSPERGVWGWHSSCKGQGFIDAAIRLIKEGAKTAEEKKDMPVSPIFESLLEYNNGVNLHYDKISRVAGGLSFNITNLYTWNSDGELNEDQNSAYIALGPYIDADYMISEDFLLKLSVAFTYPVKTRTTTVTDMPTFISICPHLMTSSGFDLAIDYTIVNGMKDYAPGKNGEAVTGSRMDIRLSFFW